MLVTTRPPAAGDHACAVDGGSHRAFAGSPSGLPAVQDGREVPLPADGPNGMTVHSLAAGAREAFQKSA